MEALLRRAFQAQGGRERTFEAGDLRADAILLGDDRSPTAAILLPPLGEGASTWLRMAPHLAPLGLLIALDRLFLPLRDPALDDWVEAILLAATSISAPRVDLVGASIGGIAALRAARRSPGRFGTVFCLALDEGVGRLDYLETFFHLASPEDVPALLARAWSRPPGTTASSRRRLFDTVRAEGFRALLAEVAAADVTAETARTRDAGVAVRFARGEADGVLTAAPRVAPSPGSTRVFAACGHYPQYESPAECAGWILEEIERRKETS